MTKIISPVSFFLLFVAVIAIILYIIFAALFADKLKHDINIEKFYNPKEIELEEAQLAMIRYFENYRIASDGAVVALLLIIALCCILLVLKIK